jgi:hypothetical protein
LTAAAPERRRKPQSRGLGLRGGQHTKVVVGDRRTVVSHHNEVNEITAKQILKQVGVTS